MQLNLVGLVCPMPLLKLKKYLAENSGKSIDVELVLTDKGSLKDVPAFCAQQGLSCELLKSEAEIVFRVQRF